MEYELEKKFTEFKKKINTILLNRQYIFFNIILHQFHWKVDENCPDDCYGYIQFEDLSTNKISNNSIYIGKKILEHPNFNVNNFLFFLIHEILHIVFLHGPRKQSRDLKLWNIATDHVINLLIKNTFTSILSKFVPRPFGGYGQTGGCILFDQINGIDLQNLKLKAEEVYDILKKYQNNFEWELISSKGDIKTYKVTDKRNNNTFTISVKTLSQKDNQNIDQFSRVAREIYKNTNRCSNQGFLYEVFQKFFESELPWDDVLKNVIKKSITSVPNSRGWQTLNKLYIPHGYTLPGVLYEEDIQIDTGVISIDTSGSIGTEDLQKFANVLVESLDYFKTITLICHDSRITNEQVFNNIRKHELYNFIRTIGFQGRGGTSHKDVFDRIQDLNNKSFNGISLYMSLTDGFSDIESCWNSNSWSSKNEISTCFILTPKNNIPEICKNNKNIKYVIMNS